MRREEGGVCRPHGLATNEIHISPERLYKHQTKRRKQHLILKLFVLKLPIFKICLLSFSIFYLKTVIGAGWGGVQNWDFRVREWEGVGYKAFFKLTSMLVVNALTSTGKKSFLQWNPLNQGCQTCGPRSRSGSSKQFIWSSVHFRQKLKLWTNCLI